MSNFKAKQFYLDQIKKDNPSHRNISSRMKNKFDASPAQIRKELLRDGYITISKTVFIPGTRKLDYYFKLVNKKLKDETTKEISYFWEDGTPKSQRNAFDLSTAQGLFTRSEIAAGNNRGAPLNYNTPVQVIAYSRA